MHYTSTLEIFDTIEESFQTTRNIDTSHGDASAYMELQARIALLLVEATKFGECYADPILPRQSSLSKYKRGIEHRLGRMSKTDPEYKLLSAVNRQLIDFEAGQSGTFVRYRNMLGHGAIQDEKVVDEIAEANTHVSEAIRTYLRGLTCTLEPYVNEFSEIRLESGKSLAPYFLVRDGHVFHLLEYQGRIARYLTTNPGQPVYEMSGEGARAIFEKLDACFVPHQTDHERLLNEYFQWVRRDLQAFTEPETKIVPERLEHCYRVEWVLQTATGGERRIDDFSIGPHRAWLWSNGEKDQSGSYADFLRTISNWNVVVERTAKQLRKLSRDEVEASKELFDHQIEFEVPESIAVPFMLVDDDLEVTNDGNSNRPATRVQPDKLVDKRLAIESGQTTIIFVRGEAGIGKTHNLLQLARTRAEYLESDIGSRAPLYFFVSCSGAGLRRLDQLVNDSVVNTQNLNYDKLAVLCANSIATLIIDGFDELLGFGGYRDASELLDPFVKKFAERGALILTARSSYYENQYRKSLNRNVTASTRAKHEVIELGRWSRSDIDVLFNNCVGWRPYKDKLSDADTELLGVPFFARVFNSFVANRGSNVPNSENLRSILIESFLERELKKLQKAGTERILSLEELGSLFCELAGYMHIDKTAELPLEDFHFVCQTAVNLDPEERDDKVLLERMSVLCGMSAKVEDDVIMFAFEHDVFYEVFLGQYLLEMIQSEHCDPEMVLTRFSYAPLGKATVAHISESCSGNEVSEFLEFFASRLAGCGEVARGNFSSLFVEHFGRTGWTPNAPIRCLNLDLIDFLGNPSVLSHSRFVDCVIDELYVGPEVSNVIFEDCRIQRMHYVKSGEYVEPEVKFRGRVRFGELIERSSGADDHRAVNSLTHGSDRIAARLMSLGFRGLEDSVQSASNAGRSEFFKFCLSALTRLGMRNERQIVVEKSGFSLTADLPRWMSNVGSPQNWSELLQLAVDVDIAEAKPLTASGPAKLRVFFTRGFDEITDSHSCDPVIRDFWERANSQ